MVFIETSIFTGQIKDLISDELYLKLQEYLARQPSAGDLIRGSSGCRKLRWKTSSRGKRGGIRVIYYWMKNDDQILMLFAYAKASVSNLTVAQIKVLGLVVADELKERQHGR